MRLLLLAIAIILGSVPALAGESADSMTPTAHLIDTLQRGIESNNYLGGTPRSDTTDYRVKYSAWKEGTLVRSGEVHVLEGDRGANTIFNGIRKSSEGRDEARVAVHLYVDVPAGRSDAKLNSLFQREKDFMASLPMTRFEFAGLEFYVLVPGADRIEIDVDKHQVKAQTWSTIPPSTEELQADAFNRHAGGTFEHVASYSGLLQPVAEFWQILGTASTVN